LFLGAFLFSTMTNRDITSQFINILKSYNKDNRISRRFILKTLQDIATFLIAQKWGDRSIVNETNLYTYIPCFEFEKINTKDCPSIEFRLCKTLMKSVKPLPKLVFSRLGSSIRDVVSLDGNFTFTYVDEIQYRRNKKRQHKLKNEVYIYLGSDNHLYIPEEEIYSLDITVLTTDSSQAEDCSSCQDEKDKCKSKWDNEFVCPDKLIEAVKDMGLQKFSLQKRIQSDQNPNGIENA